MWTIAQVKSILKDENYIGNSVHNRQSNISFKNKKKVRKPQEEWFRVENTHEAIIAKDVFLLVQQDEEWLLKQLLNTSDKERCATKKKHTAEFRKAVKRKSEVDGLFAKMYEDCSAGRITEYNFNMLSEKY